MINRAQLLTDLQALLRKLEADLLDRSDSFDVPEVGETLRSDYEQAKESERTAQSYEEWRSDAITQMASAWVLSGVFVRFVEDNQLIDPPVIAGSALTPSPSPQGYRVHTSQSRLGKGFDRGINCGQPDPHSRRTDRRNRIWRPSVDKKGAALYEAVRQHQSVNIRQISRNRAEQVAYYRFLENENVTVSELVRSLSAHCQHQVEGRHVDRGKRQQ